MRCPRLYELPPSPPGKTGWPWTEESPQLPDTMPDGRPWPRVSIVTPSLNQGQFIEETIRSALLQGYPNLEYIIMDGGSTDNSIEIIKKYEPWITYWESKKDRGQAHAINKGFKRATGEIIAWLNSDDRYLANAISRIIREVNKNPYAVAWVGGCQLENPDGKILSIVIPKGLDLPDFSRWGYKTHFYQPSCFFNREAFFRVNGLNENLKFAMDFDLWLKLSKVGRFAGISDIISVATIHRTAKTQDQRLKMHAEAISIQIIHGYIPSAGERLTSLLADAANINFTKFLKGKISGIWKTLFKRTKR